MFVPKGTEVVRTKGRAATQENVFRTANDPILPDLPLAVLINGNSLRRPRSSPARSRISTGPY